jgi:uncharacterized protein (DUF58 family)
MSYVSRYLEPALVEGLNHLQLSARRVVEGATTGLHKSPLRGASIEFRQHRAYVAGDELRRLDWRVLGRTDRPYIKEYDQETNLRCAILLDSSGSMAYGGAGVSKFDYASKLVASLAYLMLANTEAVGMGLFSEKLSQFIAPRASTAQLSRIIESLERSVPRGLSKPARAMHEAANHLGRRALVMLVSDLFTPVQTLREGLARLGHDRHEVIVLRVLDRDEIEFPFKNWARFRGMESEKPQLVDPAVVRKNYLANFEKHREETEAACGAAGAYFATIPTDQPLLEAITQFLHRRESQSRARG